MKTALFIGRFQPFHKGHHNAATAAAERYDLVIGIGSAQYSHTPENPLSFEERRRVLENCLDDPDIVRLNDQDDNAVWTRMVEEAVDFDVVLSGNKLVRELLGANHPVKDPEYLKPEEYSGTNIRERIVAGEEWTHLVPDCSRTVLEQVGFAERVQSAYAAQDDG